jgi:hypothetical protein
MNIEEKDKMNAGHQLRIADFTDRWANFPGKSRTVLIFPAGP